MLNRIPLRLREDPEIILAFLEGNQSSPRNRRAYVPIPLSLTSNKPFLLEAVERSPQYLGIVADVMQGDLDLALAAICSDCGAVTPFYIVDFLGGGTRRAHRLWFDVAGIIYQKLILQTAFVKLILGSLHFSDTKKSNLSVLNQGDATTSAWKKLIAEYAGVPTGVELTKLRRGRNNLKTEGVQWNDPKF